jgi:hypothetical protein
VRKEERKEVRKEERKEVRKERNSMEDIVMAR